MKKFPLILTILCLVAGCTAMPNASEAEKKEEEETYELSLSGKDEFKFIHQN